MSMTETILQTTNYEDKHTITLLKENKIHLKSRKKWDEFASKNNVPDSKQLLARYHNWKRIKTYAGVGNIEDSFSHFQKNELTELMKVYETHLRNEEEWDAMALKMQLPPSYYVIEVFGTWRKMLVAVGLEEDNEIEKWDEESLATSLEETLELLRKSRKK